MCVVLLLLGALLLPGGKCARFKETVLTGGPPSKTLDVRSNGDHLTIYCGLGNVFESANMPQFQTPLNVSYVELSGCTLPASQSLADVLATINVTMQCDRESPKSITTLKILGLYHPPQLTAKHFIGLECLTHLELENSNIIRGSEIKHATPEKNFLAPLKNLESLKITSMIFPNDELDALINLKTLEMAEIYDIKWLPTLPALTSLKFDDWQEQQPIASPENHCGSLYELYLKNLAANSLPSGWLMNCSSMEELEIVQGADLTTLPLELLIGASSLKHLTIRETALKTLPVDLLDYSPNLQTLVLGNNRLHTIPSESFFNGKQLETLNLNSNQLNSKIMAALEPLQSLTELNLARNELIGDICGRDGFSLIRKSSKLRKLLLFMTGVSRICQDWREMKHLQILDLSSTKVSKLTSEDLHFSQTEFLRINLEYTPLTVELGPEDYKYTRSLHTSNDTLKFEFSETMPLKCDCHLYWARRIVELPLSPLGNLGKLSCLYNAMPMGNVPAVNFVCLEPKECDLAGLPKACECKVRPDHDPANDRFVVSANCRNASLSRVPHLQFINQSTERVYELSLSQNHITKLEADDIQENIKALDLSYNYLRVMDEETASRLGDVGGMLRLAGNPLDCSCHASPLKRVLSYRDPKLTDRDQVKCENGTELYRISFEDCPTVPVTVWVSIGLGVFVIALVTAMLCFGTRDRRFFAQAVLHHWGLEWRSQEEDDCTFDVFLTFAHNDETVAREILLKLEPRYRVCMHLRDWIPGRLISEQVMESVQKSRRTVSLVSRHFLTSKWTQEEFRAAHTTAMLDTRPRLVVIFLEEPSELDMSDELKRYVATRTYLRRADPWFWDKLAVALPRPRAACTLKPSSSYELEPMVPSNDGKSY